MLSSLLSPFVAASALGLVLSIVVHLCAWLNIASPLGRYTWLLHVGIFVVWFPTVLVSGRLTREYRANDFWKAALRGCPLWMRRMVYFFGAYAMLNFVIFILSEKPESPSGAEMPPVVARGFSGHWMLFYSAALPRFTLQSTRGRWTTVAAAQMVIWSLQWRGIASNVAPLFMELIPE